MEFIRDGFIPKRRRLSDYDDDLVMLPKTMTSENNGRIIEFSMIRENQFCITGRCLNDKDITNILNESPSKFYNDEYDWEFSISDYDDLLKKLQNLEKLLVIPIPNKILAAILKPLEIGACTCLKKINPKIVDELLPFQKEGVCDGIGKMGKVMLADEMGLDKKLQALAIADYFRDSWPLFICTTRFSKEIWMHYIKKFYGCNDIELINLHKCNEDLSDAKVIICAHKMMTKITESILKIKIGCVIFDESQHFKNSSSQMTQSALQLSNVAKRVILISGSPAYSMPCELFSQLRMIDEFFKNSEEFEMRYCEGERTSFGWHNRGHSNLPELKLLLRHFIVRRTKNEIMPSSNLTRKAILLDIHDIDGENEENEEYRSALNNHNDYLPQENVMVKFHNVTAKLKKEAVCYYLKTHKNYFKKTVIYAYHIIMLDAIEKCLIENDVNFVRIDGSTSELEYAERIEEFKICDTCKVILMSLKSAESGVELTEASSIIFAELDWSPITLVQAESRVHRFGNANQIDITYLLANKTTDKIVWKMLKKKEIILADVGIYDQHLTEASLLDNPSSNGSSLSEEEESDSSVQNKDRPENLEAKHTKKKKRKHSKKHKKSSKDYEDNENNRRHINVTHIIEDSDDDEAPFKILKEVSEKSPSKESDTSDTEDDAKSDHDIKPILKSLEKQTDDNEERFPRIQETPPDDFGDDTITIENVRPAAEEDEEEYEIPTENIETVIKQEEPISIIDIQDDSEDI